MGGLHTVALRARLPMRPTVMVAVLPSSNGPVDGAPKKMVGEDGRVQTLFWLTPPLQTYPAATVQSAVQLLGNGSNKRRRGETEGDER